MYFWDNVASGASDFNDGCNAVLHEFAHQLDSISDQPMVHLHCTVIATALGLRFYPENLKS
jgi:hypothetical protein